MGGLVNKNRKVKDSKTYTKTINKIDESLHKSKSKSKSKYKCDYSTLGYVLPATGKNILMLW